MSRKVIECIQCHKKLGVPNDRGEIQVTCPHCALRWFWTPPVDEPAPDEGVGSRLAGFLGKAVSRVMGTSAVLSIEHCDGEFRPGGHIDVTVLVSVGAHETAMKELYLEIVGEEVMRVPWSAIRSKAKLTFAGGIDDFTHSSPIWPSGEMKYKNTTYSRRLILSQGRVLEGGGEKAFTATMEWPKDIYPTFEAERIQHLWSVRAVMSVTGTNPSTDWYRIHIVPK